MLTGNVKGKTNRKYRSKDLRGFLKKPGRERAKGKVRRSILDNYSARKSKETNGYLSSEKVKDRFVSHFIPTHLSWLAWLSVGLRK
jgi:transposase